MVGSVLKVNTGRGGVDVNLYYVTTYDDRGEPPNSGGPIPQ
jgi:hypothetical protein